MDATEYCQYCGRFGFFTAEDNMLCPECGSSDDEAYFGKEVDDMFIDGFWENFDAQFDEGEE